MENSIQKIQNEIELKRKRNEETLKLLKEKSIIYNAQKEKQKKYFFNKTHIFLNRKRKNTNNNDKNDNNEDSTKYDNYTDYDDYIDDFMNNSFLSTRTFNNLNFCRPERFSFRNKKKKLLIKNEEEFTINKTNKPKEKYTFSNVSITLSNNININKNKSKEEIKNNDNIKDNNFGNFCNFGFTPKSGTEINNISNSSLFGMADNNKNNLNNNENKVSGSLFSFNSSLKGDNNSNNNKSLFSSNITGDNKEKEKEKENDKINIKNEDKKENKQISLFGDLNRLSNISEKGNSLFGSSKQEKLEKLNISEITKKEENNIKNINSLAETPKKNPPTDEINKKEIMKIKMKLKIIYLVEGSLVLRRKKKKKLKIKTNY